MKLMEDYGALGNDTVLSIYIWIPLFKGASILRIGERCCTEMLVHQYQSTLLISQKTGSFPLWCQTFCMYIMCSVMLTMPNVASAHVQPSLMES